MNKVMGVKMSKEVEKLIRERVSVSGGPYMFRITGVTGHGYDLYTTAHIAYEKIKKWAEREGAEVSLIADKYQEIADESYSKIEGKPLEYRLYKERTVLSKNQSKGFILIEVTDPAARIMEELIMEEKRRK